MEVKKPSYVIMQGDVREQLRQLRAKSAHVVITSPPYWRQRDYQVEGQIGLEGTPEEFIETLVGVFRDVHRVLRDDGTLFVNLGDSYASTGGKRKYGSSDGGVGCGDAPEKRPTDHRLQQKEMLAIPWRFALAMRERGGWLLRQEIIWEKLSPMPETVKDRFCKAHEHVFLFTKQPGYFWDIEQSREPVSGGAHGKGQRRVKTAEHCPKAEETTNSPTRAKFNQSFEAAVNSHVEKRNPRSVIRLPHEPTREKHFAAYPSDLVAKLLKAAVTDGGCCEKCGTPWRRIVKSYRKATRPGNDPKFKSHEFDPIGQRTDTSPNLDAKRHVSATMTVGWKPGCACIEPKHAPMTVLDCFNGTGTTLRVACAMGHHGIGIELSEKYVEISHRNIARGWKPRAERRAEAKPKPKKPIHPDQKAFKF